MTDSTKQRLEFGKRLKSFREARELSQDRLAQICGWTTNTRISGYERGANEPSLDDIALLANALQVYPEVLAYGAENITQHIFDALSLPTRGTGRASDIDLLERIHSDLATFRKQQRKRSSP